MGEHYLLDFAATVDDFLMEVSTEIVTTLQG